MTNDWPPESRTTRTRYASSWQCNARAARVRTGVGSAWLGYFSVGFSSSHQRAEDPHWSAHVLPYGRHCPTNGRRNPGVATMSAIAPTVDASFRAGITWLHGFRSIFSSRDAARMGPYAVTVYLVIKAPANFKTGNSFPSIDDIVDETGMRKSQVHRTLVGCGQLEMKTATEAQWARSVQPRPATRAVVFDAFGTLVARDIMSTATSVALNGVTGECPPVVHAVSRSDVCDHPLLTNFTRWPAHGHRQPVERTEG